MQELNNYVCDIIYFYKLLENIISNIHVLKYITNGSNNIFNEMIAVLVGIGRKIMY